MPDTSLSPEWRAQLSELDNAMAKPLPEKPPRIYGMFEQLTYPLPSSALRPLPPVSAQEHQDDLALIRRAVAREGAEAVEAARQERVGEVAEIMRPWLMQRLGAELEEIVLKKKATRSAYMADYRRFVQFWKSCDMQDLQVDKPPVSPDMVAGFVVASVEDGESYASVERIVAALTYVHELMGLVSPSRDPIVRAALKWAKKREESAVDRDNSKMEGAAVPEDERIV